MIRKVEFSKESKLFTPIYRGLLEGSALVPQAERSLADKRIERRLCDKLRSVSQVQKSPTGSELALRSTGEESRELLSEGGAFEAETDDLKFLAKRLEGAMVSWSVTHLDDGFAALEYLESVLKQEAPKSGPVAVEKTA